MATPPHTPAVQRSPGAEAPVQARPSLQAVLFALLPTAHRPVVVTQALTLH